MIADLPKPVADGQGGCENVCSLRSMVMLETVPMAFYVELEFHNEARGHEAEVLWRSQLPDTFSSTDIADAAGRQTLRQMSKPIDVVSYRIFDDAGNVVNENGKVVGRRNNA